MQPLISQVDHESRHVRVDVNNQATENTPLLPRFPPNENIAPPRSKTTCVVGTLLFIFIVGMVISIYLLIVQSNSENVLPPVYMPNLQLVTRAQWDPHSGYARPVVKMLSLKATYVIIVQTDTRECSCYTSCLQLLHEIKVNGTNGFYDLPYNFLVAEYGETFEGLGWRQASPLFTDYASSGIVIAVIGNYTHVPPTRLQLQQSQNLITESISQEHLDPTYKVLGKTVKYYPRHLFKTANQIPHWSDELTDEGC